MPSIYATLYACTSLYPHATLAPSMLGLQPTTPLRESIRLVWLRIFDSVHLAVWDDRTIQLRTASDRSCSTDWLLVVADGEVYAPVLETRICRAERLGYRA